MVLDNFLDSGEKQLSAENLYLNLKSYDVVFEMYSDHSKFQRLFFIYCSGQKIIPNPVVNDNRDFT